MYITLINSNKIKIVLLTIFVVSVFKVESQCIIDSVEFNYYSAMDLNDINSYKTIDSTLIYDTPNSTWVDYYENNRIYKRDLKGSIWRNNYYTFDYLDLKISKIIKHTKGFGGTLEFEYENNVLVKIINLPKFFKSTEYNVSYVDRVYKLLSKDKSGIDHWHEIDLDLLDICGGIKYGEIDFLDFKLDLNITNSIINTKNEIEISQWPNNLFLIKISIKDDCGNTTLYAEKVKETKTILELIEIKYYYK